jgi:hypothetical protein
MRTPPRAHQNGALDSCTIEKRRAPAKKRKASRPFRIIIIISWSSDWELKIEEEGPVFKSP